MKYRHYNGGISEYICDATLEWCANDPIVSELGACIDTMENLLFSLKMNLPDSMHLEGLKGSLPKLKQRLDKVYEQLEEEIK